MLLLLLLLKGRSVLFWWMGHLYPVERFKEELHFAGREEGVGTAWSTVDGRWSMVSESERGYGGLRVGCKRMRDGVVWWTLDRVGERVGKMRRGRGATIPHAQRVSAATRPIRNRRVSDYHSSNKLPW